MCAYQFQPCTLGLLPNGADGTCYRIRVEDGGEFTMNGGGEMQQKEDKLDETPQKRQVLDEWSGAKDVLSRKKPPKVQRWKPCSQAYIFMGSHFS